MMPSTLSPSREAVQVAAEMWGDWDQHPNERPRLLRYAEVALRAAYAIDVAPLVDALRPFAEAAGNPNLVLGEAWYQARAVLARSQERHK